MYGADWSPAATNRDCNRVCEAAKPTTGQCEVGAALLRIAEVLTTAVSLRRTPLRHNPHNRATATATATATNTNMMMMELLLLSTAAAAAQALPQLGE